MKRKNLIVLTMILAFMIAVPTTVSAASNCSQSNNNYSTLLYYLNMTKNCNNTDTNSSANMDTLKQLLTEYSKQNCNNGSQGSNDQEKPEVTPEKPTPVTPPDSGNSGETGTETQPTTTAEAYAKEVLDLVNEERAAAGLSALTLSDDLTYAATLKSKDMVKNNYFSHTSPTYGSPFDLISSLGIKYSYAGENIAMGYQTPAVVMNAWMNSSGHKANILNANYTQMGLGYVVNSSGQPYWTQLFMKP